jgi:hypothetical protein
MTRERLLWRLGNYKKLSFECPEVIHEEKSALHFKQKVPEVGRPHGVHDVSYYSPNFHIFVIVLDYFVPKQSLLDLQIFEVELLSH